MKNLPIIIIGFGLGYSFNTETGKKLRNWAYLQAQSLVNKLADKVNDVTTTPAQNNSSSEEGK